MTLARHLIPPAPAPGQVRLRWTTIPGRVTKARRLGERVLAFDPILHVGVADGVHEELCAPVTGSVLWALAVGQRAARGRLVAIIQPADPADPYQRDMLARLVTYELVVLPSPAPVALLAAPSEPLTLAEPSEPAPWQPPYTLRGEQKKKQYDIDLDEIEVVEAVARRHNANGSRLIRAAILAMLSMSDDEQRLWLARRAALGGE